MTPPIVQKDDPEGDVLREKAAPVTHDEIGTPELMRVLTDMKEALSGEDDGVAIAAPQIGVSKRIFAVSGRVFKDDDGPTPPDRVFINPEIVKTSKETALLEEGCLSVRPWYGNVSRALKARVRALDENGKTFELGGSGLLAQIFQHEIDHLDGVLFVDKAEETFTLEPKENKPTPDVS